MSPEDFSAIELFYILLYKTVVTCVILQMVTCHLVEKHKFGLLEIHESYETYLMRREQTTEV